MPKIKFLSFVDREEQAMEIAQYLLGNERSENYGKPRFVTSGQMFGSGKTELGRNATSILKNDSYKNKRKMLEKVFGKKETDRYINAQVICIDIRKLKRKKNLNDSLAFLLATSMAAHFKIELKSEKLDSFEDIEEVISYFQKVFPKKSFFLHWDEVILYLLTYQRLKKSLTKVLITYDLHGFQSNHLMMH